ncbi:MAG: hypothetical protein ACKOGA_21590, partial [Planctomycetaceae bacterium]
PLPATTGTTTVPPPTIQPGVTRGAAVEKTGRRDKLTTAEAAQLLKDLQAGLPPGQKLRVTVQWVLEEGGA